LNGGSSATDNSDADTLRKGPAASTATSRSTSAEHGVGAKVALVIKRFAPQTCINELAAPIENDIVGMHLLRIVLQIIVCWQHVMLLVDWLGSAGHQGIGLMLPLTNDVARMLGRVNTTFSCLTTHLSMQSVMRTLQAADRRAAHGVNGCTRISRSRDASEESNKKRTSAGSSNGSSNEHKPHRRSPTGSSPPIEATCESQSHSHPALVKVSAARATFVVWLWVIRRWIRQVGELALWTWYFNVLSADIPWSPFPDFVQVWYKDRANSCKRWMLPSQAQLPMWLLSLFFVYEPVNSVLELHQPPVSLCHNLQVA
jgi:hypothetical protein